MDDMGNAVAETIVTKALGEELRRVRDSIGWSRGRLVAEMGADIHVQTLATYEQGARQCTVVRLVEICRAMGVAAPDVLALALQRAEIDLRLIGVLVNLRAAAEDERAELQPIRTWAAKRLEADSSGTGVVYLDRSVLHEMSLCFGYSEAELVGYLKLFTPERAPQQ
jgi:transcriptional regulator with XRE-family HTH domain